VLNVASNRQTATVQVEHAGQTKTMSFDGIVICAGGHGRVQRHRDIRADRIQPLVNWVNECFPGVDTRRVEPWAGLRPMMPNMLTRVGAGKKPTFLQYRPRAPGLDAERHHGTPTG
jgi:glycine/D-amino acid oxidase-like deaminating enzyme